MRSYAALSDHDFELLVADLLSAESETTFEAFARGADLGVDLRCVGANGVVDIVQCKHMVGSTYPQLRASARKEATKLKLLNPQPTTYRFVTSQSLTQLRKRELALHLAPWIARDDDILGADDLELLLNRHSRVERSHVKLWLSSGAQLDERLHAETWTRSRQLYEEIRLALPRYVETGIFWQARKRLREDHVLIVTGPPGIGKTTLARMLLADAVRDGFDAIEVSCDIEEAYRVINNHSPQVFYYDDFLGSTFLEDRLAKNEDKRLSNFVRLCLDNDRTLLVLTTREHILRQAATMYEVLDREGVSLHRLLLTLRDFTRLERAMIFYNHAWHSGQISPTAREQLSLCQNYASILDHPNYSPRLIEYITGLAQHRLTSAENDDYVGFAVDVLDKPDLIWRHAFERQLSLDSRNALVALASMPTEVAIEDLHTAFDSLLAAHCRAPEPNAFRDSLRVLDDCFCRTREKSETILVSVADPSVEDFVAAWLASSGGQALAALEGVAFFEQLQWLFTRVVEAAPKSSREGLRMALARAVLRCWSSPHPGWQPVYYDDDVKPTMSKQTTDSAERLAFVNSVIDAAPAYADCLGSWFETRLDELPSQWLRHITNAGRPVALVRVLAKSGRLPPNLASEAVAALRRNADYSYAWSCLFDLREIIPDSFTDALDVALKEEYEEWAQSEIREHLDSIHTTHELDEILRMAVVVGAHIEEGAFETAWDDVASRQVTRDFEPDPDAGYGPTDAHATGARDEQRIEALFCRLRDS